MGAANNVMRFFGKWVETNTVYLNQFQQTSKYELYIDSKTDIVILYDKVYIRFRYIR